MAVLDAALLQRITLQDPAEYILADFKGLYEASVYPPQQVYGSLLLCAAIQHKHSTLVELLLCDELYLGKDVMFMDYSFPRPLHTAVIYADHQLIKTLLDLGLDSNQIGLAGIHTQGQGKLGIPIEMAICKDDAMTMKLLEPFYDPKKTHQHMTLLHYACKYTAENCLSSILSEDAVDIDQCSNDGWTPLMFAAQKSPATVKKLLAKGADVRAMLPGIGHTALQIAVILTRDNTAVHMAEIVRVLVEGGADVTHASSQGEESALTLVCSNLMPMALGFDWTTVNSKVHSQQVLDSADILLKNGVLQSAAHANPIISVQQKLHSIAGGMSTQNSSGDEKRHRAMMVVLEDAFCLAKDLIHLCIVNGVDVNKQNNRLRKTPAAYLIWTLDTCLRQSNLAGNPYLAVRHSSDSFKTNTTISLVMIEIFTELVLHGSHLTGPLDRTSLFTIVKADFERFSPFLIVFLNSLNHDHWVNVMHEFLEFIKTVRETMSHTLLQDLNSFSYTRSLKQMCRWTIVDAVKSASMTNNIQSLPLPEAMKAFITNLT